MAPKRKTLRRAQGVPYPPLEETGRSPGWQSENATRVTWEQRQRSKSAVYEAVRFAIMMLLVTYTYYAYGVALSAVVAFAGWLFGWMKPLRKLFAMMIYFATRPSYAELLRRADIMRTPIKEKETVTGENDFLEYGFSCMQGWRRSMEDAHTLLLLERGAFFGVYDGHSGAEIAKYCGEYMFQFVQQTKAFMKGDITRALHDGFIAIDKYLHSHMGFWRSGCTAVVLYVDGDEVYCANAGDSRCVMCRNGSVFALSNDHKPYLSGEQVRIERAGCFVQNMRVNGKLALSRAIGDFIFKDNAQVSWEMQAVTSAPEVRVAHLNRDKDEFAVLACDGIWDVMTSNSVVDFVRPRIQKRVPLGKICEELMDACLSAEPFGLGCDNMSVIIIKFKRGSQNGAFSLLASPSASVDAVPSQKAAEVAAVSTIRDGGVVKEDDKSLEAPTLVQGIPSETTTGTPAANGHGSDALNGTSIGEGAASTPVPSMSPTENTNPPSAKSLPNFPGMRFSGAPHSDTGNEEKREASRFSDTETLLTLNPALLSHPKAVSPVKPSPAERAA